MKSLLGRVSLALVYLYAGLILSWFVLHLFLGDRPWWLSLLNSFAPFFFAPLLLLLPVGVFYRRRSFWLPVLLPCLLFLLLYGRLFLPRWPAPRVAAGPPLAVMTFNIWGFSHEEATARIIVEKGMPDLVALQELSPEMAQLLVQELGESYPYRILDPGPGATGMGILSRYPLVEIEAPELTEEGFFLQIAQVQVETRTPTLYNCHPTATNVLAYVQAGISVADRVEVSRREREALVRGVLQDAAARPGPAIVAGDWNGTEQSDVYRLLTRRLEDSHAAAGWGFGHTFPAYRGTYLGLPTITRMMRVDMIFYSDELVALESRVGEMYGESDHLPVVAKLGWR